VVATRFERTPHVDPIVRAAVQQDLRTWPPIRTAQMLTKRVGAPAEPARGAVSVH